MNIHLRAVCLWLLCAVFTSGLAAAQEISGFSTISFHYVCVFHCPRNPPCALNCGTSTYMYEASPYMDTEEDYVAALYYNVQSTSALYFGGSNTPLTTASIEGNPTASGTYNYDSSVDNTDLAFSPPSLGPTPVYEDLLTPGVYTEVTDHILDFFYVTSAGAYYDPYGFSVAESDGGYDSGYWFSVDVYATYIQEASVVLGESYDSSNNTENSNVQGPSVTTVSYQAFIPTDYAPGPGILDPSPNTCPNDIYAGDNRTFDPSLESYRAMQFISVGVGGMTSVPSYPGEATGWSYEFNQAVLKNNQIPASAYNFHYKGQCTTSYVNEWGHASTNDMPIPSASYSGSNQTNVTLSGSASNPIPLFAFPISWNASLTLSEPDPTDLHVTGVLTNDCYPAHELSVGEADVATWMPTSDTLGYITACLGGFDQPTQLFTKDIPLSPPLF